MTTAPAGVVDYQYVVSPGPTCPSRYQRIRLAGVELGFDPRLPVCALRDRSGAVFGTLVGIGFDMARKRRLFGETEAFDVDIAGPLELERDLLPRLAGAFLLLTHGKLPPRIYLDPGGSLPLVYSPQDRRAASSAALLFDDAEYRARFDRTLHEAMVAREVGGWISGTLTAHKGVYRVLPNHFLDLQSWSAQRYWPRPDSFAKWLPFEDAVERAATALRDFTNLACSEFRVSSSLTAGFDSRLLLASARDTLSSCSFFTFTAPGAQMDVDVSRVLAEKFSLRHQVLEVEAASEREQAIWDRTVGDCMVEQNRVTHRTLRKIQADAVFVGMYGELGRCRLYRQDPESINAVKIDGRFVTSRLTIPAPAESLENIDAWFAGVADQPNSVILDLAFLELKFGSWGMGQHAMHNSIRLHLLPFAQRAVYEAFLGVEPTQKGTERLFRACIERLWPELLDIPVNKYGDYRDYLVVLGKLSSPSRVRRYLRDRLARKH